MKAYFGWVWSRPLVKVRIVYFGVGGLHADPSYSLCERNARHVSIQDVQPSDCIFKISRLNARKSLRIRSDPEHSAPIPLSIWSGGGETHRSHNVSCSFARGIVRLMICSTSRRMVFASTYSKKQSQNNIWYGRNSMLQS